MTTKEFTLEQINFVKQRLISDGWVYDQLSEAQNRILLLADEPDDIPDEIVHELFQFFEFDKEDFIDKKLLDEIFEKSFITDKEKMIDFFNISKEAFLFSYSYITEKEYEATKTVVKFIIYRYIYDRFLDGEQ